MTAKKDTLDALFRSMYDLFIFRSHLSLEELLLHRSKISLAGNS